MYLSYQFVPMTETQKQIKQSPVALQKSPIDLKFMFFIFKIRMTFSLCRTAVKTRDNVNKALYFGSWQLLLVIITIIILTD